MDKDRLYQEEFLHEMKGLRDDIKGTLGDSDTMKKILKGLQQHRGQDGDNGISIVKVAGKVEGSDAIFTFTKSDETEDSFTLKDFIPKDGYSPVKDKDYFDGKDGLNATIAIGKVSVGDKPEIKNVGTEQTAILDIVLPKAQKGEKGDSIRGKAGDNGSNGRSFVWQGIYLAGKSYKKDDVVEFDGSSYIAINDNANRNPTDVSYWNLMAQKGRDGVSRGGGSGSSSSNGVNSIVAGTNITVDNTDPKNPIVSASASSAINRLVVNTIDNYTVGSTAMTDYVYLVSGSHNGTMPAASGNSNRYTIKNKHSASVTITSGVSDTIEGTSSITIDPSDSVDLISNNTNEWNVI